MKQIFNKSETKSVKITKDFNCFYIQHYKSEEQVLEAKQYSNLKNAEKYALRMLG